MGNKFVLTLRDGSDGGAEPICLNCLCNWNELVAPIRSIKRRLVLSNGMIERLESILNRDVVIHAIGVEVRGFNLANRSEQSLLWVCGQNITS